MNKTGLKEKAGNMFSLAKTYWKTPAKGNFVSYKEILNFGLAGFGAHWTTVLASTISLSAGNFIVGACMGLKPMDLQIMMIVANVIGIPIAVFRGYLFDHHHMKGGKFLPFMWHTAFPTLLIATLFVWMPYENWDYMTKAVMVEIMYILMNVFLCFFNEANAFLPQVITPNSQERTNVMAISQIINSLAPTITNLIIPTIAGLTFGMNDIRTYRYIYPVFTVFGFVINWIFFHRVHERFIIPKHNVEHVRLADAIREVAKNKYFWIVNVANWAGFLEGAYGVILGWTFVYAQGGKSQAYLGVANTVIGNAALWAMIITPFAINRFGKRNLLIGCNLINVILLMCLYPAFTNIWAVVIIIYLNSFISVFGNIYLPGINADMRDYHQYRTGVRIDGLFGPLGLIGTVLGFFTGMVVPAVYEKMGLLDDYDVLYNDGMRNSLFKVLIVLSVIGAIMNVIPYFFYDLTEDKHRGYTKVLRIRVALEDYADGVLDDDELVETVEIIHTARECLGETVSKVSSASKRKARRLPKSTEQEKAIRQQAIHDEKEKIRSLRLHNSDIINAPIVVEELDKFKTDRYKLKLHAAEKTLELGEMCDYSGSAAEKQAARKMPRKTAEQKAVRADAIELARIKHTAEKLRKRHYKNGFEHFDNKIIEEIQSRDTKTLTDTFRQRIDLRHAMKKQSVYQRAVKPYKDAQSLVFQAKCYNNLDSLEEMYNNIKCGQSAE